MSGSEISSRARVTGAPDGGHGWLVASVPAGARRFRVDDPGLAQTVAAAGGELVATAPDVEIATERSLTGAAPCAILVLEQDEPEARFRGLRGAQRSWRAAALRRRVARARGALRAHGYAVRSLAWERGGRVREARGDGEPRAAFESGAAPPPPAPEPLAHRFALHTVVVGERATPATILDDAVAAATGAARSNGGGADGAIIASSGVLVLAVPAGILRVALGGARERLDRQSAVLAALERHAGDPWLRARLPAPLAQGEAGLAGWTLERRLSGGRPREPVEPAILDQCVRFLTALHGIGSTAPPVALAAAAAVVAAACDMPEARALNDVARWADDELEALPRGFAHGDFWSGNLLVERDRLTGVVDWSAAGPGRLPLVDLIHLRVSAVREALGVRLGPALLRMVAAGGMRDHATGDYCARLGLELRPNVARALVAAYWLDALALEVLDNDRGSTLWRSPAWRRENVEMVLRRLGGWWR